MQGHEHHLQPLKEYWSGWQCAMSKKGEGGCLSGITEWYETINIQGFKCKECEYTICLKCALNKLEDEEQLKHIKNMTKSVKMQS